jgi:UPF0755 protein
MISRTMSKFWAIPLSIVVIGLPSLGLVWYTAAQAPMDPKGQDRLVEIRSGLSTRSIAAKLKEEDLIRSELAFLVFTRLGGFLLQAGVYRFSPAMTLGEIMEDLAYGQVAEHLITIPEGWRLTEIADLLERKNVAGKDDFLKAASGQEGYLFPDTYRFSLKVTSSEIVDKMRQNFDQKTKDLALDRKTVILASIVEREAKTDEERASIAAVYLNRLKLKMRLEADPTVQYAKTLVDLSLIESWPKITTDDYRGVQSPYNTYLSDGLPPGPICNPGLASLQAVLAPAPVDYLYFFHAREGQTNFSKTLEEHNAKKKEHKLAI